MTIGKSAFRFLAGIGFLAVSSIAQYHENGAGYVLMQAENTKSSLGTWKKLAAYKGFTGSGHLESTANNPSSGPAASPLAFPFILKTAGEYTLFLSIYKNLQGEAEDKCNDFYVRVEGDFDAAPGGASLATLKADNKLFGGSSKEFAWSGGSSLDQNGVYSVPKYAFKAGKPYTLYVSGRAQRANLDRILFALGEKVSAGQNPATSESLGFPCAAADCKPDTGKPIPGTAYVYKALDDFVKMPPTGSFTAFVDDASHNALMINAATPSNRGRWAAAEAVFTGESGSYSLKLTGLKETDGETSYRIYVNGVKAGPDFMNPSINQDQSRDYEPEIHSVASVVLKKGDKIRVESDCASNGKIPEGSGYAWARGRWTQVQAVPLTSGTVRPVRTAKASADAGPGRFLWGPKGGVPNAYRPNGARVRALPAQAVSR